MVNLDLVERGIEQCLVDPCVFRLMVNDKIVAIDAGGAIKDHGFGSGRSQQEIPNQTSWRGYVVHGCSEYKRYR